MERGAVDHGVLLALGGGPCRDLGWKHATELRDGGIWEEVV